MELHLNEQYNLWDIVVAAGKSFIQPFLEPDKSEQNLISFIMPLEELKTTINQHYVSNKPLMLTYEYYDHHHNYQCAIEQCTIQSTISNLQQVAVRFDQSQHFEWLHLDQIIRATTPHL